MKFLFGKRGGEASVSSNSPNCVIPAWSAGIQVDTDVSGSILADLDAGYPCRHDEVYIFIVAGERKLMNYFVDNVQRTASIRLFQRGFLHRHPSVASEARKTSEQCPNLRLKTALSDLIFCPYIADVVSRIRVRY